MNIAIAQISPIWLDREKTLEKVKDYTTQAAQQGASLVCFSETLVPGYPFWVEITDGARFNDPKQKELYAHYLREGVCITDGDLDDLCQTAKDNNIAIYVGVAEKAMDRGGHSIYCTLVYIDQQGEIKSSHRKLMPTYEERMVWSIGDGNGLVTHKVEEFTVGGLNCWENWMPLPRAALYAQGENLHVSVWPGNVRNTEYLTRHIAVESRSYVISASSYLRREDIPEHIPYREEIYKNASEVMCNGGSCIAAPDGTWVVEPVANQEKLIVADIDLNKVYEERHNFDPSSHYSRPDVLQLTINRERQSVLKEK